MTDRVIDDLRIDFGRRDDSDCTGSLYELLDDSGPKPWKPAIISGETVFTARIGPTGGKRGYTPITGEPSWGIAWYLNDKLIPEIYVERGQSYTFYVEGGADETNPAKFHPFYITSSREGGFGQKKEVVQREERVFAGVGYDSDGYPYPEAKGRYCEWKHKTIDRSADTETFEEYMKTLELVCEPGEAAVLNWTVAADTPDLVYYQVRFFKFSNLL